jgi:hypothetical protein
MTCILGNNWRFSFAGRAQFRGILLKINKGVAANMVAKAVRYAGELA